jgi:hypothetical protein
MKYFVAAGATLKIAGTEYHEGEIVEIRGRATAAGFGDRIIPVTDEFLLKNLEANAHPYYVTDAHRWGRIDYAVGDIIFNNYRAHAKLMVDWTRPATGLEVLDWIARHEAAQADRKKGLSINPALVATGGTVKPRRGRPPGTGKNQRLFAARAAARSAVAVDEPLRRLRTAVT